MLEVKKLLKINPSNLTQDISTNTQTLVVPTGMHYMSDVLEDLPKGVFIDKQVCGVGGTTLAIKSNTNYVIACHRKLLVENKYIQHPDTLIKVCGGVKVEDIVSELRLGKNKIITTYDGIHKVSEALKQVGMLDQYHLLVDEVQSLIREGGDFREVVCNTLLENTCNFASVSYLTATSTERKYLPDQIKDIPYLKILWEDSVDIKVKQKQIKQNLVEAITSIALEHLDDTSKGEAYFFFNSVRGVIPVIKNILKLRCVTEKDIKVICTDNDDNQRALDTLKGNWKPEKPLDKDSKGNIVVNNKTITFITKTCFEGVDYYSENPTTYIISDARNKKKHFVKTDIAIDIRQIAGRFRTSNPMSKQEVVFLWTGQHEGCGLTEEEYEAVVLKEIEQSKTTYQTYLEDNLLHDFMKDYAKTSKYFTEDNGVVKLNKLAYSNIMSEYRTQHEDFKVVIENGKELNNLDDRLNKLYDVDSYELPKLSVLDKSAIGKKINFKKASEMFYNLYSLQDQESLDAKHNLTLACPSLIEYVDVLGVEELRSCSFQESRIKKKFMQAIGAKGLDSNRTDVRSVLNLTKNCWYSLKEVKGLLSQAYKKLNYTSKAFASDIDKYYVVKRSRRSGVEGVLIICNV